MSNPPPPPPPPSTQLTGQQQIQQQLGSTANQQQSRASVHSSQGSASMTVHQSRSSNQQKVQNQQVKHQQQISQQNQLPYISYLHFSNRMYRILPPSSLEAIGYNLGEKLAIFIQSSHSGSKSQISSGNSSSITTHRDALKFICRELWTYCFGKQADRLQLNKDTGGFVILDNCFRGVVHMEESDMRQSEGDVVKELTRKSQSQQQSISGHGDRDQDVTMKNSSTVTSNSITTSRPAPVAQALTFSCGIIRGAISYLRQTLTDSDLRNTVLVRGESSKLPEAVFYMDFKPRQSRSNSNVTSPQTKPASPQGSPAVSTTVSKNQT